MSRIDIDQATVLERIVARLRSALALPESRCFEVLDEDHIPVIAASGAFVLTVSPGAGQFEDEEQIEGNTTEYWQAVVSGWTRIQADPAGHDTKLLRDANRGLLTIKGKILAALVGQDLADRDGNTFLRQMLRATYCAKPRVFENASNRGQWLGQVAVTFGVDFDWAFPDTEA